jgi:hypothetical protein
MTNVLSDPQARTAVHTMYGRNKSYLEIVPEQLGVRIQPTATGKLALNRFWTMWLRKLLLEQTSAERAYSVEVRSHSVHVKSSASPEATIGTVHHIASQVRPLNPPSLIRGPEYFEDKFSMCWTIKYGQRYIPWELITANIPLPKHVSLECNQWIWPRELSGRLRLYRPLDHPLSLSQVGMLVELELALACHR